MICMNGKRGRPATGRQESYYVIDPANFERHMNKIETERLINAYDYTVQTMTALKTIRRDDRIKDFPEVMEIALPIAEYMKKMSFATTSIKEQLTENMRSKLFQSDEQMEVYEQIIDKKETII